MRSDRVWLWAAGLAFALGASNADAAMISLISVGGAPALGGTATFDLVANFGSDRILGGATDLVWDSTVLHFGAFSFDSSLAPPVRDTSFDVVDNSAAGLVSIGFGNFAGISLPTDTVVGTLTFNAVGAPGSLTAINLSDSLKWAGFFNTAGSPIQMQYLGSSAQIGAVPLPAAVWLLLSGSIGIFGIGLRRR